MSEDEARLPDLPIRFDVAEQKMQSFRAAGQYERAEFLEQAIKKLKGAQK
ncbi:MAG TPA: hypothetical protein VLR90_04680 [Blastocatellia bacterium]|nr:hypothetical protein [Blastocatellia bacterium]